MCLLIGHTMSGLVVCVLKLSCRQGRCWCLHYKMSFAAACIATTLAMWGAAGSPDVRCVIDLQRAQKMFDKQLRLDIQSVVWKNI